MWAGRRTRKERHGDLNKIIRSTLQGDGRVLTRLITLIA